MNNWLVIYHENNFVALTSEQWNEDVEYIESNDPIELDLIQGEAISLANELNFGLKKWRVRNEL